MSFYDEVLKEISNGNVPIEFRADDLMRRPVTGKTDMYYVGDDIYTKSTIRTWPANNSIRYDGGVGKHVENGTAIASFRCIERGLYTPIDECEGVEAYKVFESIEAIKAADSISGFTSAASTTQLSEAELQTMPVAALIAETIARTPFQIQLRKQRHIYPEQPITGWGARLGAYFWPKLENDWNSNQITLQAMYYEAETINQDLHVNNAVAQVRLSKLFDNVCSWGGVNRPDIGDTELVDHVIQALAAIDLNETPERSLKINSAWTKLYAMLRPDLCVIFDSRVATSLIAALDPYIDLLKGDIRFDAYKSLGTVQQGRGGTRPRTFSDTWNNGYQKWNAQLAANKLCCDIRDYLNMHIVRDDFAKQDNTEWTLREVEAVLFMDGY